MSDGLDINILTGRAKEIAAEVDNKNVKDGKLSEKEISVFLAECEKNGIEASKEPWYSKCSEILSNNWDNLKGMVKSQLTLQNRDVAVRDATYVAPRPEVTHRELDISRLDALKSNAEFQKKQKICSKLYNKWQSKFPNSPLKEDFYEKLYDVIDTLKVEIPINAWDKKSYSSPKEQAMDQVIAIFAGEAQLNPKAKNGIYNGLFQLAEPGLKEAKMWANKHKDVAGMSNIKNNMTINAFRNLSGKTQLDYLVAYIGKCKEYSKIGKDETITPAQLWAMIKYPFKGKNNKLVHQKNDSIQNVFKNSKVEFGTEA